MRLKRRWTDDVEDRTGLQSQQQSRRHRTGIVRGRKFMLSPQLQFMAEQGEDDEAVKTHVPNYKWELRMRVNTLLAQFI